MAKMNGSKDQLDWIVVSNALSDQYWEDNAGILSTVSQVERLGAPAAHRFAAGLPGVTRQDVVRDGRILDEPFRGCTPLDLAIACDNHLALEELLEMGADPNNKEGLQTVGENMVAHPLYTAIFFRRPRCLQTLLRKGSSVAAAYPDQANKTIQQAVARIDGSVAGTRASEKVMEVLLASKEGQGSVDVFMVGNKMSGTALMFCIVGMTLLRGDSERRSRQKKALARLAEMLVKVGADTNRCLMWTPPLWMHCEKNGSVKFISMLLKHGANPHGYAGPMGSSCLNIALSKGRLDIVKILLDYGVDVNAMAPNGKTPFEVACRAGNASCFKAIVRRPEFRISNSDFRQVDTNWKKKLLSPEEKYYMYNYLEVDKDLPEIVRLLSTIEESEFVKFVEVAVAQSEIDFECILLQSGNDIKVQDKSGKPPMCLAAKRPNSQEILKKLLSNGADINAMDRKGKTPLFEAAHSNQVENVAFLYAAKDIDVNIGESTNGTTPLHLMAQENNPCVLEILLNAPNADINVKNKFGASPLHYAAKSNAKEAASSLIKYGACVNMTCTIQRNTPLHVAAACNSTDVAYLLVKSGAKIDEPNINNETSLFLATATGSKDMLDLLFYNGADIDARDKHGQTPLHVAVNYKQFDVVHRLLDEDANIEERNFHRKETILHIATSAGTIDFVKYLLSRGADKEAKDYHGMTPLLRSAAVHSPGLTLALMQLGCDVNACLSDGKARLDLLDLLNDNSNRYALSDLITICPTTKKIKFHPLLSDLPEKSKNQALAKWRELFGPVILYHG